jgi:TolA-binding protein
MMREEEHIELFERYRNDELSDAELRDFEARLAYDSEFKAEFGAFENIENGIKTHFRAELKSKLQEVDKEMDDTPKKKSIVHLLAWTSSIASAIVIGVFIFQHFSQPNYKQLAQRYWPYEEGLPVKMSTSSKYDEAMNAFKLQDWSKAENLLSALESDTASYFLGEVAYQNNKQQIAISYFSGIEKSSVYYQKAQFKLALLFMTSGNTPKSKEILGSLINENSEFSDDAQEILRKI